MTGNDGKSSQKTNIMPPLLQLKETGNYGKNVEFWAHKRVTNWLLWQRQKSLQKRMNSH